MDNKYVPLTAYQLTILNFDKMKELKESGYTWDKKLSIACVAVAMVKLNPDLTRDIWIFDLEGGVHHNPPMTIIQL